MRILLTGSSGFIGFHLAKKLVSEGYFVTGIDNMNDYYELSLKEERLKEIIAHDDQINKAKRFNFHKIDLSDKSTVLSLFDHENFDCVINLAAQAGVRYSLENPYAYLDSNLSGFLNILEGCRKVKIKHLIFASSSSVYGMNSKQPFDTTDRTDHPISLYAATKKSNELMAFTYSHLFKIPTTGLRFFTVYGPYGRPDMAYFKFTKSIIEGQPIEVYNSGKMKRDFTYIDDIVDAILKLTDRVPREKSFPETLATAPYILFNIGNNNPVTLDRFICSIENALNMKAKRINLDMQPGDVPITFANIDKLDESINFKPSTKIEEGIEQFVKWYKSFYREQKN